MCRRDLIRFIAVLLFLAGLRGANPALSQAAFDTRQVMALITQAESALQHQDLPGAETLFRRATALAPEFPDAFFGLGLVELREGSLDQAIASLQKAASLSPSLQGPHLFLGIAQYQVGEAQPAIASLRAELALNPDNAEALTWMGIASMSVGLPEQAVGALDHLATLKPNDPQVLYYKARAHSQVAETALAALVKLDPDSALVHRATAENFDALNQPDKAIAEYQAALRKSPNDAELLEALGDEDQKVSHFDDAQTAYQQELTLQPQSSIALYALGKMDIERGKPAEGVALMRRAQAAHAIASPTDFYLGLGLAEMGQNEEAARWLEASLKGDPPDFVLQGAWYQLARVYAKLNRKADQQDALAHLKQVLDAQARAKEGTARAARAQTPSEESKRTADQP